MNFLKGNAILYRAFIANRSLPDKFYGSLTAAPLANIFAKTTARASTLAGPISKDNVLYSPFGDVATPTEDLTKFIFKNHKEYEDLPAITCGVTGKTFNYKDCYDKLQRFGKSLLQTLNLKPGDTIALVLPNIPEFVFVIFGALSAGLTVTLANPLYTKDELTRQFNNCNVNCIVTIDILLDKIINVSKSLPQYHGTITIGDQEIKEKDGIYTLETLLKTDSQLILPEVDVNSVALIPYSSGTTGLPKGVVLTHKNLVVNLLQIAHKDFCKPKINKVYETVLTVPPFFHIYGFNGIMNYCLSIGSRMVSMPRFTPEDYIKCLNVYKPRMLFVVPSLLTFLASHPKVTKEHLSSVTNIMIGAAPVTESTISKFLTKCEKNRDEIVIQQGFGMTESSPVMLLKPYNFPKAKVVSAGQIVPGTECKVVSLISGENLGPNMTGELMCRGPQVMKEYHNNEAATRATIDADGWLHTGDVAYYDDDHYLYVVDRTKELIKVKGNQVSPTELENIVMEIKDVSDAAVASIPDDIAGELPRAYVVIKAGKTVTEKEIYDWVAEKVTKYKRLEGGIIFVDAIPRNPGGKILRNELKLLHKKEATN